MTHEWKTSGIYPASACLSCHSNRQLLFTWFVTKIYLPVVIDGSDIACIVFWGCLGSGGIWEGWRWGDGRARPAPRHASSPHRTWPSSDKGSKYVGPWVTHASEKDGPSHTTRVLLLLLWLVCARVDCVVSGIHVRQSGTISPYELHVINYHLSFQIPPQIYLKAIIDKPSNCIIDYVLFDNNNQKSNAICISDPPSYMYCIIKYLLFDNSN